MSERRILRQRALTAMVLVAAGVYAVLGCAAAMSGGRADLSLASFEHASMVVLRGVFDTSDDW